MQNKPSSLADKIAQLIFVRIGSNMAPPRTVEEDSERIASLLKSVPLGGLCLFNGKGPDTSSTLRMLQELSSYPLLIGTDMERGVGQQMRLGTSFPHARAFGALKSNSEDLVEEYARIGAREALSLGIHIAFAPVADVSRNPRNPIIATRAFGEDPETVSGLVRAFVKGCKLEGLLSTAKHFPGHGNTDKDSHDSLPVVSNTREELKAFDLPPFQAAIDEGVDLLMTAHVAYPAWDGADVPATSSQKILTDLLRRQMGFDGAVITDSLLMEGISEERPDEISRESRILNAGADILLDVKDPTGVIDRMVQDVESGFVSEQRIDEAFERIWKLKQHFIDRFGPDFFTDPKKYVLVSQDDRIRFAKRSEEMAASALTEYKTDRSVFPCPSDQRESSLVVMLKPFETPLDPELQPLADAVKEKNAASVYVEFRPGTSDEMFTSLLERASNFTHVLVAAAVKPAAWRRFGLTDGQKRFVSALCRQQKVALVALGSPLLFEQCPGASAEICMYSDEPPSQIALATIYFQD